MHEICEDLREKGKRDLKKLTEKADLSPTEWANAKTVLSAMCKMNELEKNEYGGESYTNYPMDRGVSTRRGRSPSTGRYISMDNRNYYDNGMSGHGSVSDRMLDMMDRMYDSARNDQERREINKWIDRVQNGD